MEHREFDLTEAEWSVMECLWDAGAITGRELAEKLQKKVGWSRSTSLTLLRRLVAKGAVADEDCRGVKTYRPLVAREEAALRETNHLLERAYRGSVSLLVSTLTRKQDLPQEEIDELYAILRELEEKRHD